MTTTQTIDYPIINFNIFLNRIAKTKTEGYAIQDWLCVGWSDSQCKSIQIYNCFGYRVTTLRFAAWNDAVQMAQFLDEHYGEYYFNLWEDDPKANIPQLTQYSIPNGTILYQILENKHVNQLVEYEDMMREYEQLRLST